MFLVIAALNRPAVHVPGSGDWCNWVVPAVLLVWAVKFTEHYPDVCRTKALTP